MPVIAVSLLTLALASTAGSPRNDDWLPASGTDQVSVNDIDFAGRYGFAAGSFNRGLVSDDGGYSWTPISVIPAQGQSLLWGHAASRDELFAARIGLYHSIDRGQTWQELGNLGSSGGGNVFDLQLLDADHLVAIKGGQIQLSTDAGLTWSIVYPGEFDVNFDELHFPTAQIGYASGGISREGSSVGNVLRSDDGGASWTLLEFGHSKITAADFIDADHALVATQSDGFFFTSDGAQSWQFLADVPDAQYISDLAHRGDLHWYATTYSGCIYESVDGGRQWQPSYCDGEERALSTISLRGGAAVAGGNDGLVLFENRIFRDGLDGG
jgi:photosystem II stability/assembly factor-like uncharacterized protein